LTQTAFAILTSSKRLWTSRGLTQSLAQSRWTMSEQTPVEQKKVLLRMPLKSWRELYKESQKIGISLTALINVIIQQYLERHKLNKDG
jgi:hypothetical protein